MAMTRTTSGFCRLPLLVALGLVGCGGDSPQPDRSKHTRDTPNGTRHTPTRRERRRAQL